MSKIKIISIIVSILIVVGFILILMGQRKEGQSPFAALSFSHLFGGDKESSTDAIANQKDVGTPPAGDGSLSQEYHDLKSRFTLNIPKDFQATEMPSGDDEDMVVFEQKGGLDTAKKSGFQIFILPFDEEGPITVERIHEDIPNLAVSKEKNVLINGVAAVVFEGNDQDIGPTIEAWFTHKGFLYQISTYREYEVPLSQILSTWKFVN